MDLFYISLKKAISDFYDNIYAGEGPKHHHLSLLRENYDPNRFKNCDNLESEKKLFLTEIQELLNNEI